MSNNIEEDINIVEKIISSKPNVDIVLGYRVLTYTIGEKEIQVISNILEEYKKNQKIVDGIKNLIETDYRAFFEGNAEFPEDATEMKLVKYVTVEKLEKILKEE